MAIAQPLLDDRVIDIRHVDKVYPKRVRALQGVSMRVHKGEVYGLLGPNGAGKSTLVKILMTVVRPTKCEGTLLGHRVGHKGTLSRVGYLPEHHRFPDYLKGRQVLDLYGAMSGVPRHERRRRAGELMDRMGMTRWASSRVRGYSKGMRQRLGIAQAMMNDPDLLLLDEPTDGVDPVGRREIRELLQSLRDEGRTVFLNSHLLSELEMVCDRVAIMVRGVIGSQGTIDELAGTTRRYEIELHGTPEGVRGVVQRAFGHRVSESAVPPPPTAGKRPPTTDGQPSFFKIHLDDGTAATVHGTVLHVETDHPGPVQPVIDELRRAGGVLHSMRPYRPSLEDLFMQAVTDPTTGAAFDPGGDRGRQRRVAGDSASGATENDGQKGASE